MKTSKIENARLQKDVDRVLVSEIGFCICVITALYFIVSIFI